MFISYVLCLLMFHSILALDGDEEGDDYEYDYDEDEDEDDATDEEYDDDYYDYEGDIEDFDYDKLKEIENSLNSINLDPLPTPSPEEMAEYRKMKNMRASLDGLGKGSKRKYGDIFN